MRKQLIASYAKLGSLKQAEVILESIYHDKLGLTIQVGCEEL